MLYNLKQCGSLQHLLIGLTGDLKLAEGVSVSAWLFASIYQPFD